MSDVTQMINGPVPFTGSADERAANLASHAFGEERCLFCDCRPWHVSASYPCGETVPRAEYPEADYLVLTGDHGRLLA